jgi:Ni/Fe-hydrogenase subunit HybB-like protein
MEFPNDALVNYIFPNNAHVVWSLMIVIYPFITGLIAGAFVVSGFYHVFNLKEFKPISNLALVAAFCFALFAATPLLVHLGQPQRAFEIYFTPHLTSPMSMFGYVYGSYVILLAIEVWFVYRAHFVRKANETKGFEKRIWTALTLGVTTYHPHSAKLDERIIHFLALIGIPWACLLHGYVGFVFGSVKAISWWATALQPIIFLTSAIVSGMAMLMLMYTFLKWRRKEPYDYAMIKKFIAFLWGIFLLDWALEMLELLHVWFRQDYEWTEIGPLLAGPLYGSYILGQVTLLSFVPTILLGYTVLSNIRGKKLLYLANIGSLLLVLQVLVMRFNVVIGGQLISKSRRGFVDFDWVVFGKEGVLTAILLLSAPFVAYYVISRFIPIFGEPGRHAKAGDHT